MRSDKPFLLITNNASYSPQSVKARLAEAGADIPIGSVLTSAMVALSWIKANGLEGASSFVLGPPAVTDQFRSVLNLLPIERGQKAELVFVARDPTFDYEVLATAADSVRDGAHFIAANRDSMLPVEGGYEPGTGALLAAVEVASGRNAIVMGKPEPLMMQAALAQLGRDDVLMIGDRLESDIRGAASIGWDSALVHDSAGEIASQDLSPDHVAASLGELLHPLGQKAQ